MSQGGKTKKISACQMKETDSEDTEHEHSQKGIGQIIGASGLV